MQPLTKACFPTKVQQREKRHVCSAYDIFEPLGGKKKNMRGMGMGGLMTCGSLYRNIASDKRWASVRKPRLVHTCTLFCACVFGRCVT